MNPETSIDNLDDAKREIERLRNRLAEAGCQQAELQGRRRASVACDLHERHRAVAALIPLQSGDSNG